MVQLWLREAAGPSKPKNDPPPPCIHIEYWRVYRIFYLKEEARWKLEITMDYSKLWQPIASRL